MLGQTRSLARVGALGRSREHKAGRELPIPGCALLSFPSGIAGWAGASLILPQGYTHPLWLPAYILPELGLGRLHYVDYCIR